MSIFRWTAPIFKLAASRWSEDDFQAVAAWLRPYVPFGGTLMDLGGGTGDLGIGVARRLGASVVVVDSAPQMLARVTAQPFVSVRLAAAESLPFANHHFDAVLCSDAFHHFRDQEAAVAEMRRTVRPGGGVAMLELDGRGMGRILAVIERLLGEPATFRDPLQLKKYLAERGIVGTSWPQHGLSYAFLGAVRE
jgi:demethylmenaquinone methyltransferase/2-methoxy-6-polyprenyl-1,4-benzoquinol methylase